MDDYWKSGWLSELEDKLKPIRTDPDTFCVVENWLNRLTLKYMHYVPLDCRDPTLIKKFVKLVNMIRKAENYSDLDTTKTSEKINEIYELIKTYKAEASA